MHKTRHIFATPAEAISFLDGIDFTNDSALEGSISDDEPCVVVTEDDDASEDEENEIDYRA